MGLRRSTKRWLDHICCIVPTLIILAIAATKLLNMFDIGRSCNRLTRCLETTHTKLHSIKGHNFCRASSYEIQELIKREYAIRLRGFEFGTPRKDDRRNYCIGWKEVEKVPNGRHVPEVLVKRILESELRLIKHLRPIAVGRAAKYPTAVVFIFNYENAEARNKHMVYLGGLTFPRIFVFQQAGS